MKHRRAIHSHYEPRISPYRAGYDILDWASPESQQARFHVLVENVPPAGKSLLDVGCGLGDLWGFLKDRKIAVDYTGVDLVTKMVEAARQRHPDGRFVCADIFQEDTFGPGQFDVVFCSGAFNLNLGNNREFLPVAIRRLVELSREHVVFNLLHHRARSSDPRYFYFVPKDVRRFLAPIDCEMRFIDDYLPNDFTVICTKTRPAGQA